MSDIRERHVTPRACACTYAGDATECDECDAAYWPCDAIREADRADKAEADAPLRRRLAPDAHPRRATEAEAALPPRGTRRDDAASATRQRRPWRSKALPRAASGARPEGDPSGVRRASRDGSVPTGRGASPPTRRPRSDPATPLPAARPPEQDVGDLRHDGRQGRGPRPRPRGHHAQAHPRRRPGQRRAEPPEEVIDCTLPGAGRLVAAGHADGASTVTSKNHRGATRSGSRSLISRPVLRGQDAWSQEGPRSEDEAER